MVLGAGEIMIQGCIYALKTRVHMLHAACNHGLTNIEKPVYAESIALSTALVYWWVVALPPMSLVNALL